MKLYLVRHGAALPASKEPSRPLSGEGQRGVERIALFLREAGVKVNHIYHSDKLRAAQTASILGGVIAPDGRLNAVKGLGPHDSIDPVL